MVPSAKELLMARFYSLVLICNIFMVQQLCAEQLIYIEEDGGGGNPRGLYNFDTNTGISTFRAPLADTSRFYGLAVRPPDGTVFTVSPDESRSRRSQISCGRSTSNRCGDL